jgi:hypothetical protein
VVLVLDSVPVDLLGGYLAWRCRIGHLHASNVSVVVVVVVEAVVVGKSVVVVGKFRDLHQVSGL